MSEVPPSYSLRIGGPTLISKTYNASVSWGRCVMTPERITVSGLGRQHTHRKSDLVELRWNDCWRFGSLVVISVQDGEPLLSCVGFRRYEEVRAMLDAYGYTLTEETHGFQGREALDKGVNSDVVRYGLLQDLGSL